MYKIQTFREVFKGRQDIIPKYWESKTGKSGYSPLCRNEWNEELCNKPCRTCDNADYIPLSDELILKHFQGKHILGSYPLLPDNTCNFIASDFDNHDRVRNPLKDVKEFYEVCNIQEIPSYVLKSKSGNGYHAYIFFEEAVPAWKARRVGFALIEEAGAVSEEDELNSFDRLFPNQDESSGRGFGNLIALPFQGKAAKYGNTLFLDPDTKFENPYEDQWMVLSSIERTRESKLDEIIKSWNLERSEKSAPWSQTNLFENGAIKKILECDFIKWCKESPEKVSEPLWYAMISNVITIRPGGYSLCHELSKGYPEYNRSETDQKIIHALNDTAPHTCEYIRNEGFDCKKDCGVKSPAALVFKPDEESA